MLKKIAQLFKTISFFYKRFFNTMEYQGWDKYGKKWIIKINKKQQLWVMIQNNIIRNGGYYKPYRTLLFRKYI